MIVADTILIAYLLIEGEGTAAARAVFMRDAEWAAPYLWRSELRSVLVQYMNADELALEDAIALQKKAEDLLRGREFLVRSRPVLQHAADSSCSAYDCEFVALARKLRVPLVTSDRRVLSDFPDVASDPAGFVEEPGVE